MDGTTSGGGVHLKRVETALLAAKSQHVRYSRRRRNGNSPVSSIPPIRPADRPYRPIRWRRRRGRLKIESIKVSQTRKGEMTYRGRASAAQPPVIDSKHAYRVIGLRRRHGRMKIETGKLKIERVNDKKAQREEMTYLELVHSTQPRGNSSKHLYGVVGRRH